MADKVDRRGADENKNKNENNTASAEGRLLCLGAACLHLCVFAQAVSVVVETLSADFSQGGARGILSQASGGPSTDIARVRLTWLHLSVYVAYGFDILIITARDVVPYSRCKLGREIIFHHLPVLLLILPLGIPYYMGLDSIVGIEPARGLVPDVTHLILRADGWAFISSLNEAIMCLQNVTPAFLDKRVVVFEMAYKVLIFTLFAFMSVKLCVEFDIRLWATAASTGTAWTALGVVTTSPITIRTWVWMGFVLSNYPSMAKRATIRFRRELHAALDGENGPLRAKTK